MERTDKWWIASMPISIIGIVGLLTGWTPLVIVGGIAVTGVAVPLILWGGGAMVAGTAADLLDLIRTLWCDVRRRRGC